MANSLGFLRICGYSTCVLSLRAGHLFLPNDDCVDFCMLLILFDFFLADLQDKDRSLYLNVLP